MLKKLLKFKIDGSIDIGCNSIKGISLKKNKVDGFAVEYLPQGAILSGNIEDHLAVKDVLKEISTKLKFKNKNVIVSLPIQNFFVKFIEIPLVEEKEKLHMIEAELEDIVPNFDPDDFLTHYVSLGLGVENENIMAITIPKEKIKEIIEILESEKIVAIKIVPDFVSLFNLLSSYREELVGTDEFVSIMLIDIGAEATKLFIERDGVIKMHRIIAIGGNDFTDIIERIYNVDSEKAEEEKRKLELKDNYEYFEEELYEEEDEEVYHEIGELVEELNQQIIRSIEFYKSQESVPGVDAVILLGGASKIKGYDRVLEKNLMMAIKKMPIDLFFSIQESSGSNTKNKLKEKVKENIEEDNFENQEIEEKEENIPEYINNIIDSKIMAAALGNIIEEVKK